MKKYFLFIAQAIGLPTYLFPFDCLDCTEIPPILFIGLDSIKLISLSQEEII